MNGTPKKSHNLTLFINKQLYFLFPVICIFFRSCNLFQNIFGFKFMNIRTGAPWAPEIFRWPTSGGVNSRTRSVCISVSLNLSGHLTWTLNISIPSWWNWTKLFGEIFFWNFWRHSWDVGTLIPNESEFLVCLSVCYLAYSLTEIPKI